MRKKYAHTLKQVLHIPIIKAHISGTPISSIAHISQSLIANQLYICTIVRWVLAQHSAQMLIHVCKYTGVQKIVHISRSPGMGVAHYSVQMIVHVLICSACYMQAHKMSTLAEVLRWGGDAGSCFHGLVAAHSDLLCCLFPIPYNPPRIIHYIRYNAPYNPLYKIQSTTMHIFCTFVTSLHTCSDFFKLPL